MARTLYTPAKQSLGTGGFDFSSNTLAAALVLSSYTFDPTHQYMSSIGSGNIAASADSQLAGKAVKILTTQSWSNGVLDADDLTFSTVTGSQSIRAIVLFKRVGGDFSTLNDDPLIAYFDDATGLVLTTSGGNVLVQWDNGSAKILAL